MNSPIISVKLLSLLNKITLNKWRSLHKIKTASIFCDTLSKCYTITATVTIYNSIYKLKTVSYSLNKESL